MRRMSAGNIGGVDLNLLVALDALLAERNVTRAAGRIGLTQPALSRALARLRATFGDALLVRTSHGNPLRSLRPPIDIPGFTICSAWHEIHRDDPRHRWLRGEVARIARGANRA